MLLNTEKKILEKNDIPKAKIRLVRNDILLFIIVYVLLLNIILMVWLK